MMALSSRAQAGQANGNGTVDYPSWSELAVDESDAGWLARTRVTLTPMAAPSIMGLFGFMVATLMVGAWQAGWYGSPNTPQLIWPFAMVAGGLLQIIAAIACFRARDGVALGVHAIWGSFWIGWSIMQLLVTTHVLTAIPLGAVNQDFAFWFIGLSLVTISAALASLAESLMIFAVLGSLAAGSILSAIGLYGGYIGAVRAGGWLFVISAAAAWLTGTAMMLEHGFGRTVIPLGKFSKNANIPFRVVTRPISRPAGMPGVRVGQ